MRPRFVVPLAAVALALAVIVNAASALTLEHVVRIDAARLSLTMSNGLALLEARGGVHEYTAGRPDLPWISERVDLPAGMRLVSVEVVAAQTELWADGVRVAPALSSRAGAPPDERSAASALFYTSASFQPEVLAATGVQGSLRGRNVAYLRIAPARWNAQTGRLERVTSLDLELTLEDGAEPAVTRERIVREWEDELPSGVPSRAIVSLSSEATAGASGKPRAEPFKPLQVPSVLGSPVEYVIVTSDALAPVFQQLADWKTQSGVPAVVRTVSFIRQQYPFGADNAERIRLFLRDAYARWGTKWVLLGGDTDVIPDRHAFNEGSAFPPREEIAADLYYACLDGNWNANGNSEYAEGFLDQFNPGDNADLVPEVYVGRAPVSTAGEAQTFVNKTLAYEKTPASGYTDRWLEFAEVLFPHPWTGGTVNLDGATLAEDMLPFSDTNPGLTVKRLYQNYTAPAFRPGSLLETRAAVLADLNLGYGLALHVGHGFRNTMSVADNTLVNSDATGLTNGNKTFNLYAIDCTSSAIDFPCIGEAFLKNPNGGAVTVIGSTDLDYPTAGRAYQQEFFRLFFDDSVSAIGELQARQKLPFVAFAFYDGVTRWTELTLIMLGDPELRMYNGAWRSLSVAAPASFALGDSSMSVTVTSGGNPVPNARVTAYKAGDEFRSGLTGPAGTLLLPFRPDSTGAFTLTVTAYNAKPYQATLNVTSAAGAAVSEAAVTVDDAAGGTSGNGDGFADAGETVDLRVALRNRGGGSSNGAVSATLTTADPYVSIVNGDGAYGSIAAGATGNPVTPFRISVPVDAPDQHEVPFTLVLWDGSRSWREAFQLTLRASELRHYEQIITESPGNNDGRPTPGETAQYAPKVRNNGSGVASSVSAKLRCLNGAATVTDSTVIIGDIPPYTNGQGDSFVFNVTATGAVFQLEISDASGVRALQTLDLGFPSPPAQLAGVGEADAVKLTWSADIDLPGGTATQGLATCNFSGASAAVKTSLAALTTGDVIKDGAGYYPIGSRMLSYNPATFVLTLSDTAVATSGAGTVELLMQTHDLAGYNVYRGAAQGGPFTKITTVPTDKISYYHDEGLAALTKFYYRVSCVDSSGNESTTSSVIGVSTNPPLHAIFPVTTGGTTPSQVAVEYAYSSTMATIAAGSDLLYVLNADGSAPVDADGQGSTLGDFSTAGFYHAAGPSMAVLAPGEGMSFISPAWGFDKSPAGDSAGVYVFDRDGNARPGFPIHTLDNLWGPALITDLDNDGHMEIVFESGVYFEKRVYVVRENGQEWMDGDANPSTKGVFKVLGQAYNISTPAAADMDGDGLPEIICGSFDGKLNVWKSNGANLPGFPFQAAGQIFSSPAVGYLDGPGDTSPEIVFTTTADSIYVLNADGKRRAGWPQWNRCSGVSRSPSVALADMNNDGFLDIVFMATNGGLWVYNRNGTLVPPWANIRFTTLTSAASESSPIVADINGDGFNDIICGGEEGQLTAISGANATVLPGFPIQLGGEVRGTPAVADIDNDGKTEIIFAGWDKNIYVWDYDFTFQPSGKPPWPQFHHDARRTGFASAPLFVGVGDGPGGGAGAVRQVEFAPPRPNPMRAGLGSARIELAVPSSALGSTYDLSVFDLSGRRVKRVDSGAAPAGRFTLRWDLKDASGSPVSGGVYFVRFSLAGKTLTHKLVVLQ